MELDIKQRWKGGVIILEMSGRLVLGEECESFRTLIRELLPLNKNQILVSMADISRIDSTGIGALVESVILTAKEGGRLKLFNLPRLIRNILSTHRLLQAFEIYETEDEAVASFQDEPHPAGS